MEQKEFFNRLAAGWDETRERDDAKLRLLVSKLHLSKQARVLDLGSGTGVLLSYLAEAAKQVTAVDFAEEMLKLAEQKHREYTNIEYLVADVAALPLAANSFEHITCLNFYPHVENKRAFLQAMQGLLVPGGRLTLMHDISRQAVNSIHGSCEQVKEDKLAPATVTGQLMQECGFTLEGVEDNEEYYFVQGIREKA